MRKAFTSKEKEIIMKQRGKGGNPPSSQGIFSLLMCFLFVFFFVSILKRHKRYFSKKPIFLTPLYTEAGNKPKRLDNRGEERKGSPTKLERKTLI